MIVKAALCAYRSGSGGVGTLFSTTDNAINAAPGQMFRSGADSYIKLKDIEAQCLDPDGIESLIDAEERSAIELEIEKIEQRLKELKQQPA